MQARRSPSPQEVPGELAILLRQLNEDQDPLLNMLLSACRDRGWRNPALAACLQMKPATVGKRVQRVRRAGQDLDPEQSALAGSVDLIARAERRAGYDELLARLSRIEIPQAPRVRAMADGKQLRQGEIDELMRQQRIAARVNGAMAADHPSRKVSERFSAEINRLVSEEGFSPYYLARALALCPRTITSRLERHHFRTPCPSVAGTASGEYHGRKIGDPGEGVARIPAPLRQRLRDQWGAWPAAGLHEVVQEAVVQGFTKASVARSLRVGLGELNRRLTGYGDTEPEQSRVVVRDR